MSRVLVVDQQRCPLMPCTPARARLLLKLGKAAVLRRFPFILILREERPEAVVRSLRLKIDPGSKVTGLALINDASGEVMWAAEVTHRGEEVHRELQKRAAVRRGRRQRHTWYRQPRWRNRRRSMGWIAPSLLSQVQNVETWTRRLMRWAPIGALSYEAVRFDTQALEHPEIEGTAYQFGTLAGLEVKEYLLCKWGHKCSYCQKTGLPLQVEHSVPKIRGGTNRVTNLALACEKCNLKKGNKTAEEFGYPHIQAQARAPLKDAAAVNSTRQILHQHLIQMGLLIEASTGGRTKWNRSARGIPKAHWLDAANIGSSTPARLLYQHVRPYLIQANRRQDRQLCLVDNLGFPRSKPKKRSKRHNFQTGDIVRAIVPNHVNNAGVHVGRIAAKASGAFTITTRKGKVSDIGYRYCTRLQRADGYTYALGRKEEAASSPSLSKG
jgi:5-methylcytosine-specific restriction endonuclease McrA